MRHQRHKNAQEPTQTQTHTHTVKPPNNEVHTRRSAAQQGTMRGTLHALSHYLSHWQIPPKPPDGLPQRVAEKPVSHANWIVTRYSDGGLLADDDGGLRGTHKLRGANTAQSYTLLQSAGYIESHSQRRTHLPSLAAAAANRTDQPIAFDPAVIASELSSRRLPLVVAHLLLKMHELSQPVSQSESQPVLQDVSHELSQPLLHLLSQDDPKKSQEPSHELSQLPLQAESQPVLHELEHELSQASLQFLT